MLRHDATVPPEGLVSPAAPSAEPRQTMSRTPTRLPPRLCRRPRILFVGINPSLHSARVGHHFASPGNPFWRLLHAAGLVPEPMSFTDDVRLPRLGLALTNIAERATREASELTPRDYALGRARLGRLIGRASCRERV